MNNSDQTQTEQLARLLCEQRGHDPDRLEPGDAYGVDETVKGEPCHYMWRQFVEDAEEIIYLTTEWDDEDEIIRQE